MTLVCGRLATTDELHSDNKWGGKLQRYGITVCVCSSSSVSTLFLCAPMCLPFQLLCKAGCCRLCSFFARGPNYIIKLCETAWHVCMCGYLVLSCTTACVTPRLRSAFTQSCPTFFNLYCCRLTERRGTFYFAERWMCCRRVFDTGSFHLDSRNVTRRLNPEVCLWDECDLKWTNMMRNARLLDGRQSCIASMQLAWFFSLQLYLRRPVMQWKTNQSVSHSWSRDNWDKKWDAPHPLHIETFNPIHSDLIGLSRFNWD